jgi:hypothetical protein
MMMRAAPGAPRLVDPATRRAVYRVAPSCRVVASGNRTREHWSGAPARLAGHDNATCPHVLHAPRYVRVLLGNAQTLPFSRYSQILLYLSPTDSCETCGGLVALPRGEVGSRAAGRTRVVTPKPSRAGRQDPEPRNAWQHWSPPE